MKSFKSLLSEISLPKGEDEQNFKDKHLVQLIKHPVADDDQHTGDVPGVNTRKSRRIAHKRKADYDRDEDKLVYEGLDESVHPTILKSVHKDFQIYKNLPTSEVLKLHKSINRVKGQYSSQEVGGKLAMVSDLLRNKHGEKHVDHYFGMSKNDVSKLDESHFDLGDRVKCLDSGMTGKIIKLDKEHDDEDEKYYTVKRDDGKVMKYSPDELKLLKEEIELDEARKSDSYQFTHKPDDPESEKRLADLKQSVKGTGKRVVLQGRLGKDNPNSHKYSKNAPRAQYKDGKRVNADVSGKSGAHSHQRIQKADASHHDVYVYNRNESIELDEISKSAAINALRKRQSHADDFYAEPGDEKKAQKTLKIIQKKFGSKTAKDAERGIEIDRKGRGPRDTGIDYLDAKSDVYSGFSRANSKKGTKQRLDYMRMNKGSFLQKPKADMSEKIEYEETELDEAMKLDRVNHVHHDSASEKFAKNYVKGHKGNYHPGGPTEKHQKDSEAFHTAYKRIDGKSGFAGSGHDIYQHRTTGEKFRVDRQANGKGFHGTDHHVRKLTEEMELDESRMNIGNDSSVHFHDSNAEHFAKLYAKRTKYVNTDDPKLEKHHQTFHTTYKRIDGREGFGGSGHDVYQHKTSGEKFRVDRQANGKSFYGTNHSVSKLHEEVELEEMDSKSPLYKKALAMRKARAKARSSIMTSKPTKLDKEYRAAITTKRFVKEEVENLDEISDELKARYHEKGREDVYDRFTGRGKYERPKNPENYTKTGRVKKGVLDRPEAIKYREKIASRNKFLSKVADHLKKEDLDEAIKIGSKVRIHSPGKDYHGKIGHVGEIRKNTYGTWAPSYTVDYHEPGEDHKRSVSLQREKIKLHREEVELDEQIKGWKHAMSDLMKHRSRQAAIARGEDPDANKRKSTKPKFDDQGEKEKLHTATHRKNGDIHTLYKQGDHFWHQSHVTEIGPRGVARKKTRVDHLGDDRKAAAEIYNNRLRSAGFNLKPKTNEEVELDEDKETFIPLSHVKKHIAAGKKVQYHVLHGGKDAAGRFDDYESAKKGASQYRGRMRKLGYDHSEVKIHPVVKEEVELDENFRVGSMKLNDGSSVIIKEQDVKLLNQMFDGLNSQNRTEMMNTAMSNKKNFDEILNFAREAL